jgi:hypothetical protein
VLHVDEDDWKGVAYGLPGGDVLVFDLEAAGFVLIDGVSGDRIGRLDTDIKSMSRSMLYGVEDEK